MSDLGVSAPSPDFNIELVQGGVKAAIAASGAKSRDLLMVPIANLVVIDGLNVRIHDAEYESHVEEIKESIIEHGFYPHKPLPCYVGKDGDTTLIYVTGGFTRLDAAKRAVAAGAAIEALPVVLKPPGTSMLDLTFALEQDNTGTPLRPYERAVIIKRAINYGSDEETVSKKLNISLQYVRDLLYLVSLPQALQAHVIDGNASAGHVVQLARKLGPSDALKQFTTEPVSARAEAEGAPASAIGEGRPPRNTPGRTAAAAAAAGTRTTIPKKTLYTAIDYAIALPGDGIKWLALWRKGDNDAIKELAAYKPPRKNAKKPKPPKPAGARGPGRPKKDAGKDPFDTGTGEEAPL